MSGTVDSATASISFTQLAPTSYQYSINLTNTGAAPIQTFWFAWDDVPDVNFMTAQPTSICLKAAERWPNSSQIARQNFARCRHERPPPRRPHKTCEVTWPTRLGSCWRTGCRRAPDCDDGMPNMAANRGRMPFPSAIVAGLGN